MGFYPVENYVAVLKRKRPDLERGPEVDRPRKTKANHPGELY